MFRVSLKLLHILKENPSYVLKTIVLLFVRFERFSNYTRFYQSLNYNQGLVELVVASRSISEGDLKPLSGVSKS